MSEPTMKVYHRLVAGNDGPLMQRLEVKETGENTVSCLLYTKGVPEETGWRHYPKDRLHEILAWGHWLKGEPAPALEATH